MTELNTGSLDDLNSTLNLTESDAAELDKLNNANLFTDSNLNRFNLIGESSVQQLANELSVDLENRACTSNNSINIRIIPLNSPTNNNNNISSNSIQTEQTKPIKRALRQTSIRNSNEQINSDNFNNNTMNTNLITNTTTMPASATVKEEPIVIIDDKDNSSLIDLTKENDDIVIVSEVNTNSRSSNSALRRPFKTTRQTIRKLTTVSLNNSRDLNVNSLPSTSASANSATNINSGNDLLNLNDSEIIHVTNNDLNSNKTSRQCVDITYHFCTRNNIRNKIPNIIRPFNSINSTIVIDDERAEQNSDEHSSSVIIVPNTVSSNQDTQSDTNSTHKRQRLDRQSHKKDNHKTTSKNNATSSSSDGSESSIHCPICLETLSELKANKKRLKSTLCGHILCNLCLEATFKSNGDGAGYSKSIFCPTCRTKLTKSKIHDLYI